MSNAPKRILVYLVLACVCYGLAVALGDGGLAFALFLSGGLIAELVFWRHLYLRLRDRAR